MSEKNQELETLNDIKRIMEKSSRFISLSGWSGVSAGLCALVGAWYTATKINCWKRGDCEFQRLVVDSGINIRSTLLYISMATLAAAFVSAFLFTWVRSHRTGVPVWGYTARKVMISVIIPMAAGGLLIYRMIDFGFYGLIAPACLLFYGLGLVNASKYTLPEIRYLGYCQIILGVINLWMIGYGLYFWAAGFGLLHIMYGLVMWWKYERT